MILLDSMFITNNGGGKILLDYVISKFESENLNVYYLFDSRVNYDFIPNERKIYVDSSIISRHLFYLKNQNKFSAVLCFANLAPSIRLNIPVYTYFHQSMYLNGALYLDNFNKLRFFLKKNIFKFLLKNSDYFLVQTNLIKSSLMDKFKLSSSRTLVLPIYEDNTDKFNLLREANTFLYVSSGSPHKNHIRLIHAFCDFYDKFKLGKLIITLDEKYYTQLLEKIDNLKEKGYPILNLGYVSDRDELFKHYYKAEYLVYPSLEESFGLGLLEAINCGCQVIAADLPYTHEVCNPSYLFDPFSSESISLALDMAIQKKGKLTTKKIYNKVEELIDLMKQVNNEK
ncbi:glycosyltransferase [Aquirufa sp. ROCK2-A2]